MRHWLSLAVLILLCVALVSCSSSGPAPAANTTGLASQQQQFAELPSPLDVMAKVSSALPADAARLGAQFDTAAGFNGVTSLGWTAEFAPATGSWNGQLTHSAWGIYRFNLTGVAGLQPRVALSWETVPAEAALYIGVANFPAARWDWVPVQQGRSVTLPQLAPYIAPDGTALVAVLLTHGPTVELGTVAFGKPELAEMMPPPQPGDPGQEWLAHCYAPLPEWRDADRVFQIDGLTAYSDQVLALTNAERAAVLLPPLQHDPHLELVAQAHSRHMALRNFFDHEDPYMLDPFERLNLTDPPFYVLAAENIAAGYPTPEEVVEGWMNSPGHAANILTPGLEYMGTGVYWHRGVIYWTQLFATFTGDPNAHDWLEPDEVQAP